MSTDLVTAFPPAFPAGFGTFSPAGGVSIEGVGGAIESDIVCDAGAAAPGWACPFSRLIVRTCSSLFT